MFKRTQIFSNNEIRGKHHPVSKRIIQNPRPPAMGVHVDAGIMRKLDYMLVGQTKLRIRGILIATLKPVSDGVTQKNKNFFW